VGDSSRALIPAQFMDGKANSQRACADSDRL